MTKAKAGDTWGLTISFNIRLTSLSSPATLLVSIPSSISLVVGNRSARTREDTSLFISSIIVLISLFEYHSSCLLHKASTEVIGSTVEEAKRTRLLFWLENDICRRQGGSIIIWLRLWLGSLDAFMLLKMSQQHLDLGTSSKRKRALDSKELAGVVLGTRSRSVVCCNARLKACFHQ